MICRFGLRPAYFPQRSLLGLNSLIYFFGLGGSVLAALAVSPDLLKLNLQAREENT